MTDGQTEVQPLPDMDPELSAPPPPLPEATIPSRHDAVATGEEGDELDYDELSQPDSERQRLEERRRRILEQQGEDVRSRVRDFLAMNVTRVYIAKVYDSATSFFAITSHHD